MAYYHPCKNCAVGSNSCSRRADIRNAIAGLHVTSIKFECAKREPLFQPNQRVKFAWSYWEPSEYGASDNGCKLIFSGTVIAESGTKFIVRADDEFGAPADDDSESMSPQIVFRNEDLVVKVKPCDITPLDDV